MYIIITLVAGCQSAILSSNEWHNDMNPAFISTIMAPNFKTRLGVPNRRGQNQKWLHHPCLLGGPKMGGLATTPLPSQGSPIEGDKFRRVYITPRLLGIDGSW